MANKVFLTAKWNYLAILNFEIDPEILIPFVPKDTELDSFDGVTYVSLVAFIFRDTKLLGYRIPFHTDFEEINLRFYIKHKHKNEWRRGVVFIKEIVPKRAITFVANNVYNENYVTFRTNHKINLADSKKEVTYSWRLNKSLNYLTVRPKGELKTLKDNSVEEFITEHYWGYNTQKNEKTMEYKVEHPRWRIWDVDSYEYEVSVEELYGKQFVEFLEAKPISSFLAEGSKVKVYKGDLIN